MQSTTRVSAIALCTLAALTACQQETPVTRSELPFPDQDPEVGDAQSQEEAASASAVLATTPETLQLERLTSAPLPSLESRLAQVDLPSSSSTQPLGGLSSIKGVHTPPLPLLRMPELSISPLFNSSQLPAKLAQPPAAPSALVANSPAPIAPAQENSPAAPEAAAATPAPTGFLPSGIAAPEAMAIAANSTGNAPIVWPEIQPLTPISSMNPASVQPLAASGAALTDLQGHWAQAVIRSLANADIVQGFADGSFRPDAPISPEQFNAMVQRAFPSGGFDAAKYPINAATTRAEAAQIVYQSLVDQGKLSPLPPAIATAAAEFSRQPGPQIETRTGQRSEITANQGDRLSSTPAEMTVQPLPQSATQSDRSESTEILSTISPLPTTTTGAPVQPAAPESAKQPAAPTAAPQAQQQPAAGAAAVAITGEVARPGAYPLQEAAGSTTVTQAIQQAGGITPSANIRRVEVRRTAQDGAEQVLTLDLWQVLQTGEFDRDLALQPGDTIVIPKVSEPASEAAQPVSSQPSPDRIQVSVVGEVRQPGKVVLQPNTPVNQAIAAAGGLNGQTPTTVELIRLNANGSVVGQAIDLNQIQSDDNAAVLHDNDVLWVRHADSANSVSRLEAALNPALRFLAAFLPL